MRREQLLRRFLALTPLAAGLIPTTAFAQAYGSGTYGSGQYGGSGTPVLFHIGTLPVTGSSFLAALAIVGVCTAAGLRLRARLRARSMAGRH